MAKGTEVVKGNQVKLLNGYLKRDDVQQKFLGMMNEIKKNQFMASLVNAYSTNDFLQKCHPKSVIGASLVAGALDLPIDQNLGFAYMVPFYNKKSKAYEAQLQIGYKGFTQLALRTGQYERLNVITVYENQLKNFDRMTEVLDANFKIEGEGEIVGFVAYMKLISGFEKTVFWTKTEVEKHASKYSQTYKKGFGIWFDNFEAMAKKTVLKNLLTHWGIMSIEMQTAQVNDQKTFDGFEGKYGDNEEQDDTPDNKSGSVGEFEKARNQAEDVQEEIDLTGTPFENA